MIFDIRMCRTREGLLTASASAALAACVGVGGTYYVHNVHIDIIALGVIT